MERNRVTCTTYSYRNYKNDDGIAWVQAVFVLVGQKEVESSTVGSLGE